MTGDRGATRLTPSATEWWAEHEMTAALLTPDGADEATRTRLVALAAAVQADHRRAVTRDSTADVAGLLGQAPLHFPHAA